MSAFCLENANFDIGSVQDSKFEDMRSYSVINLKIFRVTKDSFNFIRKTELRYKNHSYIHNI